MKFKVTDVVHYGKYDVEISHTMEGYYHRIVTAENELHRKVGIWQGYASVAYLEDVRHCTEYYKGTFPIDQLFYIGRIRKL